jgi:hypothetical protein
MTVFHIWFGGWFYNIWFGLVFCQVIKLVGLLVGCFISSLYNYILV